MLSQLARNSSRYIRQAITQSTVYSYHFIRLNKNACFSSTTKQTTDEKSDDSNHENTETITDVPSRLFVGGSEVGSPIIEREMWVESMTPQRIVDCLDRHIIGQIKAKKAVAVSLRNRWRRQQLDETLRKEILPMNILMMGPTGTGKTEIARRLAQMVDAPFIKCEATKYTEVGIVGSSAEESIKDLVDKSIKMEREKRIQKMHSEINEKVEKAILARIPGSMADIDTFRTRLRNGDLDNTKIEVASFRMDTSSPNPLASLFGGGGNGGRTNSRSGGGIGIFNLSNTSASKNVSDTDKKNDRVPISEAREIIREYELNRALDENDIRKCGIKRAEESGIIFLDEIDKLCSDHSYRGNDYKKGEGVQKELLGLIEGTVVNTDYGQVHTDHILFIAAGAFHSSNPSDLLPELQGRLPIRVELEALTESDFFRILTETESNLIEQQQALFGAEGVDIVFAEESIREIAKISRKLNENVDNIGARRLRAVISKLLEDASFHASERRGDVIHIDLEYVVRELHDIVEDQDLSKYIL